ncbi:hypothetical protein VHUM_01881 [Vanrija humicola]|uniref:Uncharacterized protein n=1 Tax=Vanrija humicola TaxID=5417 RepID=A0A7D8V113_VANHU|nr:hypothetical protein VHUM_01881 [Vanrija humicola]
MSRPVLSSLAPTLRRSVMHHARPPRVPVLKSPHAVTPARPTEGTSTPHPANLGGSSSPGPASSSLGGKLTLRHAPPPSAPSYTSGTTPDLLRWVGGEGVRLTGEEGAPLRRARKEQQGTVQWEAEIVERMRALRAAGKSRKEVADELDIPASQRYLISRVAPLSAEQAKEHTAELERQKARWGARKRLSRDVREKRKTFW